MDAIGNNSVVESDNLASELSQAVTRVRRALQRSARASFDEESLSPTEVELLLLISKYPGTGVAAVAEELGAAPNTISTLIRRLVAVGLLQRDFSSGDRRVARLTLTEQAQGRIAGWSERRADVLTEALGQFDEAQQAALSEAVPLLENLAAALYQPRRRSARAHAPEGGAAMTATRSTLPCPTIAGDFALPGEDLADPAVRTPETTDPTASEAEPHAVLDRLDRASDAGLQASPVRHDSVN